MLMHADETRVCSENVWMHPSPPQMRLQCTVKELRHKNNALEYYAVWIEGEEEGEDEKVLQIWHIGHARKVNAVCRGHRRSWSRGGA